MPVPLPHIATKIKVDDRVGSNDLHPLLSQMNLPVELTRLNSADVCWEGRGEGGTRVTVGLERKRIRDAVNSMQTGRLMGGQAYKLMEDYDHQIILIEGLYKPSDDGRLMEYKGREWRPVVINSAPVLYRTLDNWLNSIANLTSMRVVRTNSRDETVHFIADSYHWWRKAYEEHKSLYVFQKATPPTPELKPPTLMRKIAAQLPGIGWEKSKQVESYFRDVATMATAMEYDWMSIEGIGRKSAERIVRLLYGLEKE